VLARWWTASWGADIALPEPTTLRTWLHEWVARELGRPVAAVPTDVPLRELGLGSVHGVTLTVDAERAFGIDIDPMLAWEHPTIDALAQAISQR
jgi:acyl carrier protein